MGIAAVVVGLIYVGGMWKFWSGYNHTTFNRDFFTKVCLSFLWFPLLVVSKNYRSNFTKALKG
jgi:hypothetical protein